ncbi:hypothetical protein BaRGS_00027805 [Batillaria attramentaria]|uniref:UBX domain-containing protein 4 n=1 Tax=Batillaria attramentaria TaxID=370345 RepID=A0ABD0K1Z7_9CAEN
MWLGGTDITASRQWEWMNGESMEGFTDWGPGLPDHSGSEDCLEFESEFGNHWNDDYCDELNYFICERPETVRKKHVVQRETKLYLLFAVSAISDGMEWFGGNISEAIQSSKEKGSVFVVYVTGDDDMTKEMDKCWDDTQVSQLCKKEAVVAIKIKHNSPDPVVVVPASFFIGNNGVPLEIVGGNTNLDDFREKVKAALEVGAKEMIEQKKMEKMQKAAEEERQKEVERRKLGQDVQQLKKVQHEREAERQARFHKEKAERKQQMEEAKKAKLLEQQRAAAEAEARRSAIARIQFRLPDGTSVSNQFESTESLQAAHNFIAQRLGESSVTLSTAYPRRTFTEAEMTSSFMDLQLAPTAVLIVVPSGGFSLGGSRSGGGGLLSMLLAPLMLVWNFIMSFFSTAPSIANNSNTSASTSRSSTSAAGGDRARPTATKRPAAGGSSRQDGNIRRLRNAQDDDDETATWNGNSTQQM